jgi:hypothetical protein
LEASRLNVRSSALKDNCGDGMQCLGFKCVHEVKYQPIEGFPVEFKFFRTTIHIQKCVEKDKTTDRLELLTKISQSLSQLQNLEVLDLRYNTTLKYLPESIKELKKLKVIYLHNVALSAAEKACIAEWLPQVKVYY